jgi:hypothetical protein
MSYIEVMFNTNFLLYCRSYLIEVVKMVNECAIHLEEMS